MSEVNSFFDEQRKKLLAERCEKFQSKQAELIEKIAKLIESEKNYILDMIKEHFNRFPTQKCPITLTNSLRPETIAWVLSFDAATLEWVDVYRVCQICKFGILLSKDGAMDDHPCRDIAKLYCVHGILRSKTCGACWSD